MKKMTHECSSKHSCNLCGKTFVLNWHLNKHIEGHNNKSQKYCHYFNNSKSFPFEEIGCKFPDLNAEKCIFGRKCKYKICQFKHQNVPEDEDNAVDDALKEQKI